MKVGIFFTAVLVLLSLQQSHAAIDIFEFSTDQLRERYQELTLELRCPKCQNQNLAGSDSPIAADLRREIHRMLEEGFSDAQIKQFLVDRYGEFVLYDPPRSGATLLVWIVPPVLAGIGLLAVILVIRNARRQALSSGNLEGDNEF